MAVTHGAVHEEHRLGFIRRYIFSQDHKIIGIQYMMTSLFMAAVGGGLAKLIRMELGWPGGHWGVARGLFPGGVSPPGGPEPPFFFPALDTDSPLIILFLLSAATSRGCGGLLFFA